MSALYDNRGTGNGAPEQDSQRHNGLYRAEDKR